MVYIENMYFFQYYINLFIQQIVSTICKIYCKCSFRYKLYSIQLYIIFKKSCIFNSKEHLNLEN